MKTARRRQRRLTGRPSPSLLPLKADPTTVQSLRKTPSVTFSHLHLPGRPTPVLVRAPPSPLPAADFGPPVSLQEIATGHRASIVAVPFRPAQDPTCAFSLRSPAGPSACRVKRRFGEGSAGASLSRTVSALLKPAARPCPRSPRGRPAGCPPASQNGWRVRTCGRQRTA